MAISPEGGFSPEVSKEYSSRLVLNFFRHDKRLKGAGYEDATAPLTDEGRLHAQKQGSRFGASKDSRTAVAFGSGRKRSAETAARVMSSQALPGGYEQSHEELVAQLNAGLKIGSKVGTDERLNCTYEGDYRKAVMERVKDGSYFPWLVNGSDEEIIATHDPKNSSYTRLAADTAGIVKKYVQIAPRFDQIASEKPKEYGDTMARFFGSHQGVTETFIAKVLEKKYGAARRDEFVHVVGGKGFDYTEGYQVEIDTPRGGGEPTVRIRYEKNRDGESPYQLDEAVPLAMIDEIIVDGQQFEQRVHAKNRS